MSVDWLGTNLTPSDRITLAWSAAGELGDALRADADLVAREVLATSVIEAEPGDDWVTDADLGLRFRVAKA